MNKFKSFIENFIVYGLGGIINKIIPLLMLPVITRLMPDTSYFGISDLSNTIVNFFSAIAVLGMYDAMYRFFFEKEELNYKKEVCATTLFFTVAVSFTVFLLMILFKNQIALLFFKETRYSYIVYISALATLVIATNGIISAPTRMQNKKKTYLATNICGSVLGYAVAVLLLLRGYYIIALPIGAAISGVAVEIIFGMLNHSWFNIKKINIKLLKPLLLLALPLVPNFLIYWIFNSCDRLMITNLIGLDAAGVYSASAKIGQVSQLIYTAFAGGWQYFAFSTMKEDNQVVTNSKIFEYLGAISFSATMVLCVFSYWIFKLVFPQQYLTGYRIAPYLFLAPLLQMLYQVIGNQFMVIKKTWPTVIILGSGAVVNVLLNAKLIPALGIEGAAVATLAGYIVTVVICSVILIKMHLMVLSRRMIFITALVICYLAAWRIFMSDRLWLSGVTALGVIGIYLILYKNELVYIKKEIVKFKK